MDHVLRDLAEGFLRGLEVDSQLVPAEGFRQARVVVSPQAQAAAFQPAPAAGSLPVRAADCRLGLVVESRLAQVGDYPQGLEAAAQLVLAQITISGTDPIRTAKNSATVRSAGLRPSQRRSQRASRFPTPLLSSSSCAATPK